MKRLSGTSKLSEPLPNLELYNTEIAGRVLTKEANNLPFLTWPDSKPCTPANIFMLTLRDRPGRGRNPLSRRGKQGGSIGVNAGKLSQLIRYCHEIKKDFLEITDHDFTKFIYRLRKEPSTTNVMENQKNENTLCETGRLCLDFLMHTGKLSGKPDFVSENGIIRISWIDYTIRLRSGELRTRQKIHHHSFSAGVAGEPRSPISDKAIQALRDAVDADKTSRFINQRRHLHLSFLEYLGPRRGELAETTVESILDAKKMKHPMIKMVVFKHGKHVTRLVPITNMLISQAERFINTQRAEVIKKFTKSGRTDHGLLFISHTTGAPLSENTLTNEIHDLRTASGIEEKACAHMFRHAFCTNLFVTLFERHRINNPEEFELRLISDKELLDQIREWTGHKSIEGLMTYIRKAYSRITNINVTISAGQMALIQREFSSKILMILSDLESNVISREQFSADVRDLVNQHEADLQIAEDTH